MLRVSSLSYTYPGEAGPALSDVSLEVRAGECLCITGHSGCGKTTLLLALKGLLHEGTLTGEAAIDAPPEELDSDGVGLVFQNAETQIFCSTVAEEVAFGPENLCVPPGGIGERVRRALEDVRLTGFWNRNVERLSAGQKHRLAIASVLAMRPRVLLLDEPTSQLDGIGKAQLVTVLKALKEQGYGLVVVEHDLEPFRGLVDRWVVMEEGRIRAVSDRFPAEYATEAPGSSTPPALRPSTLPPLGGGHAQDELSPVIALGDVRLSYPGVGEVLRGVELSVSRGERIHLHGRNGAGKSSLLACVAGAVGCDSGSIRVAGIEVTGRTSLFGKVGYLLQNPQRQLFESTVEEEVAFSLRRLRLPAPEVHRRVEEALDTCEAAKLADRLPLSLSFGEQHRVALASVIAPRPEVLLLDEPFSGLDLRQRRRLLAILGSLRERQATTVVIASHDPLPRRGWPHRVLTMEDGTLA